MKSAELRWNEADGWQNVSGDLQNPDVVFYFGAPGTLDDGKIFADLKERFPSALIMGASTGGEIQGDEVYLDSVVAAAVSFAATPLKLSQTLIASPEESFNAGAKLAQELKADNLKSIFVLSDGLKVNGSDLVRGMLSVVSDKVIITGGLSGDGDKFTTTLVGANAAPQSGVIAALGFYGDQIRIGHGSYGGWEAFGPVRTITKSQANVLYEIDGEPALDLYVRYLGKEAEGLPGTALFFPLCISSPDNKTAQIVRTILSVDDEAKSMTFAGDVPQGFSAQLMRARFENLVEGAEKAALNAALQSQGESLAILVSCIGRRLLMGQRISDEVVAAGDALGDNCKRIGFYSYGEISPHGVSGCCELHNQTMTVSVFSEV